MIWKCLFGKEIPCHRLVNRMSFFAREMSCHKFVILQDLVKKLGAWSNDDIPSSRKLTSSCRDIFSIGIYNNIDFRFKITLTPWEWIRGYYWTIMKWSIIYMKFYLFIRSQLTADYCIIKRTENLDNGHFMYSSNTDLLIPRRYFQKTGILYSIHRLDKVTYNFPTSGISRSTSNSRFVAWKLFLLINWHH